MSGGQRSFTVPISMGETGGYFDKVLDWIEAAHSTHADAMTSCLGKLSLCIMRKREDAAPIQCEKDLDRIGQFALHFKVDTGGSWYCVRFAAATKYFEIWESDGSKPTGDEPKHQFPLFETYQEIWKAIYGL